MERCDRFMGLALGEPRMPVEVEDYLLHERGTAQNGTEDGASCHDSPEFASAPCFHACQSILGLKYVGFTSMTIRVLSGIRTLDLSVCSFKQAAVTYLSGTPENASTSACGF